MKKINKFISGNEYCLRDLLDGDTKIIIPDLQRDYCWGDNAYVSSKDKKPRELVTDFVKNIIELFEEDNFKKTTLGLIYGYEQPFNHIQICDGQQRLTTLFLLLGYINTRANGAFNRYIISEKEMQDDYEPHLQYAIRESTLYFLSDLSKHVFIDNSTDITEIKNSDWYFYEYDQDASIQSMIAALITINDIFKDYDINFENLGGYILDNLRVLYYDMENRSRGEETYVVINTTGEPLSATENIKPILLGDKNLTDEEIKKYSNQWEGREEWFWQNRGEDTTADEGMYVFFVWYWQIGLIQESRWLDDKRIPLNPRELFFSPPKKIKENANELTLSIENYKKFKSLENLNKYFIGMKELVNQIYNNNDLQNVLLSMQKKKDNIESFKSYTDVWSWLRKADLDIVLPLIVYMAEHGNVNMLYRFARRIRKNHFDGIWSKDYNGITRRGNNYVDWRYLVQILNQTPTDNLLNVDVTHLNIKLIPNVKLPSWYNDDEQKKDILKNQISIIEEYEDNKYLMGDLTPLWRTNTGIELTSIDVEKRYKTLIRICNAFNEKEAESDIQFANWFRLYRLVSGIVGLYHIDYCQSTFEGCYYSYEDSNPWWLETDEIDNILQSEDSICYMKKYIKNKVSRFIEEPKDHNELVMSWMTLKTIEAENNNTLIDYWQQRAISAFIDMKQNYIIPIEDFHWGNVFCGYSYSYTIFPARTEGNWNRKENLDSPITSLQFIPNFYDRPVDVIDMETIEKGDKEIKTIIDNFLEQ